ncbi:MAG: hypothetical protein ACO1RX_07075 [Candidatus Sericytochromatia bacterium]
MKKVFLTALCFTMGLSACTVDAEMASNLLKSLQASVKTAETNDESSSLADDESSSLAEVLGNLAEDGGTSSETALSADELNALLPAELAGYQLVCAGSGDMQLTAVRERQRAVPAAPAQPARLRPQVVQMGVQPQTVNISVEIQTDLQRMSQMPASQRPSYYQGLQQRYPVLREAQPVTVAHPNGQRDVVFAYPAAAAAPVRSVVPGRPSIPALRPEVSAPARASGLVGCQLIAAEEP